MQAIGRAVAPGEADSKEADSTPGSMLSFHPAELSTLSALKIEILGSLLLVFAFCFLWSSKLGYVLLSWSLLPLVLGEPSKGFGGN